MAKVLLYGPPFGRAISRASGGGTGGYTRNMEAYLSTFAGDGMTIEPLFHTVRGERSGLLGSFVARMAVDCWRITKALIAKRPDAVHVLATYRAALPREVFLAALCWLFGVKLIYDVKAGAFISRYEQGRALYKSAIEGVLRMATLVLVEGKAYQAFLREKFGIDSVFFPNFVPMSEVPAEVPPRLDGEVLSLLFVGYCYEGKGTKALLEGCALAANSGLHCELTLIGEEEAGFRAFADRFKLPPSMTLRRLGRLPHPDVRAAMGENDIYIYPSAHEGEGHSNSVNEAMMQGMVIVTTRHGFLSDVLGDDGAYFLESGTAESIAGAITAIAGDRDTARQKASRARAKLLAEFTSRQACERLRTAWGHAVAPRVDAAEMGAVRSIRQ